MLEQRILERPGYAVASAAGGDEALALYGSDSTIALILMDMQMPGIDGIEATQRIRALERERL